MTDQKPSRTRRDHVRELGEAVIEAVKVAVADRITSDPTFLSAELMRKAFEPHVNEAAKKIAASDEFQQAITDRLTADMFESMRPRVSANVRVEPEPDWPDMFSAPEAKAEPKPEVLSCPNCPRVGNDIDNCARVACPFRAPGAMPGLDGPADLNTVAEHRTGGDDGAE